jgi:hypothetical protein
MNVCFTSLSSIKGVTYNLYNYQRESWDLWNLIESSNSNVSTARGQGDYTFGYYNFKTSEQRTKFDIGLSLHVQYLGGYIPIIPVEKN